MVFAAFAAVVFAAFTAVVFAAFTAVVFAAFAAVVFAAFAAVVFAAFATVVFAAFAAVMFAAFTAVRARLHLFFLGGAAMPIGTHAGTGEQRCHPDTGPQFQFLVLHWILLSLNRLTMARILMAFPCQGMMMQLRHLLQIIPIPPGVPP